MREVGYIVLAVLAAYLTLALVRACAPQWIVQPATGEPMSIDVTTVAAVVGILAAVASPIALVVTLRGQAKFSEWRHERHEARLAAHDAQLADYNAKIAVLEDRGRSPT